ncbi:MAG: hypothetical protein JRH15_19095 [Deltaproteobacteria bacterium]|nr:hypothetical protein [Deltaproteobacteria bacterium]
MIKKNILFYLMIVALVIICGAAFTNAETIKNQSDCDVCEGAIHYNRSESRQILGDRGRQLAAGLTSITRKHIKIDLDGVLANNSKGDAETGYELQVYGTSHYVIIKSLTDGSLVQFITDCINADTDNIPDNWTPEIYIQGGHGNEISLNDSVPVAWEKLLVTEIYKWVAGESPAPAFNERLRRRIIEAMALMLRTK